MLQSIAVLDPERNVISVDGVGAYVFIVRRVMLEDLFGMEIVDKILPFVKTFYGSPITYLREDEMDVILQIPQGEGGEQDEPLMSMLFALGQDRSLKEA